MDFSKTEQRGSVFTAWKSRGCPDPTGRSLLTEIKTIKLVICSITHFRNWVPGCNYPGTQTRFQLYISK